MTPLRRLIGLAAAWAVARPAKLAAFRFC